MVSIDRFQRGFYRVGRDVGAHAGLKTPKCTGVAGVAGRECRHLKSILSRFPRDPLSEFIVVFDKFIRDHSNLPVMKFFRDMGTTVYARFQLPGNSNRPSKPNPAVLYTLNWQGKRSGCLLHRSRNLFDVLPLDSTCLTLPVKNRRRRTE